MPTSSPTRSWLGQSSPCCRHSRTSSWEDVCSATIWSAPLVTLSPVNCEKQNKHLTDGWQQVRKNCEKCEIFKVLKTPKLNHESQQTCFFLTDTKNSFLSAVFHNPTAVVLEESVKNSNSDVNSLLQGAVFLTSTLLLQFQL